MVYDWYPEPPRDMNDRMSYPSQTVLVESDESEDEMLGNAPPGYELLSQGPVAGLSSDEEGDSETDVPDSVAASTSATQPNPNMDAASISDEMKETLVRRPSEVEEVDRLYSASSLRPDLSVDYDQVRAAMVGFTLPPSAIPPWAANIPEGQLATLLTQQIQRIQSNTQ